MPNSPRTGTIFINGARCDHLKSDPATASTMSDRYCLDTSFLLDLLVGDEAARVKAAELEQRGAATTTEVTRFELLSAMYQSEILAEVRYAQMVERLLGGITVLPLDESATRKAANIASKLRRDGGDPDGHSCMIAGILLTNGMNTLVTREADSYAGFPGLRVESY